MPCNHSDEVKSAALTINVKYEILPLLESEKLFDDIILNYTLNKKYKYPLWENLHDWIGVDYKFSWKWFDDLLLDKEVILFFEQADDRTIFKLKNGADICKLLNNCYRFTFYVTDINHSFIFNYNDHDNLIASGTAKEWLEAYPLVTTEKLKVYRS